MYQYSKFEQSILMELFLNSATCITYLTQKKHLSWATCMHAAVCLQGELSESQSYKSTSCSEGSSLLKGIVPAAKRRDLSFDGLSLYDCNPLMRLWSCRGLEFVWLDWLIVQLIDFQVKHYFVFMLLNFNVNSNVSGSVNSTTSF